MNRTNTQSVNITKECGATLSKHLFEMKHHIYSTHPDLLGVDTCDQKRHTRYPVKLNYLSGAIDSKELLQDCLYLQPSAVEKAWTLHFCPVGATADCESAHRSCPTCGSRIDSQQVSVLGQPLNGIPSRCMTGFHSAVVQEAVVRKRSTTLRLLKQKRSTSSTWREHLRSEETHKVISETSKLGLPDATTECDERMQ